MDQFFNLNYMVSSLPILLSYLDVTLFVTAVSFPIGLAIGAVTALARIHKTPVLSQISSVYISFIRGTPFLVQLFLICFGLPQVLRAFGASDIRSVPGIVFVLLMMSLHEGAYLSEVVRGALSAVEKGQLEACRAMNLTKMRLGFSRRQGGVSEPPYDGLNLGDHVEDDPMAVAENRALLLDAAGLGSTRLLTLNQVHGDVVLALDDDAAAAWEEVARAGAAGADGVAVAVPDVTALLCFADCTPVIVVSPSGAYAVAHAGWRGALAGIPAKAVATLAALDVRAGRAVDPSEYNAYVGPHIGAECYECGPDLVGRFVERFGASCARGADHLDLEAAVRASLAEAGIAPERIASSGECTACRDDLYFSYRKSGGRCGRHSAFAGRKE